MTSCRTETIIQELDNLIEFYHDELVRALRTLKCSTKAPTLAEFKAEFKRKGVLMSVFASLDRALAKADSSLNLELDSLCAETTPEGEAIREKLFSVNEYVHDLQLLLPFLESRGYLDISE